MALDAEGGDCIEGDSESALDVEGGGATEEPVGCRLVDLGKSELFANMSSL